MGLRAVLPKICKLHSYFQSPSSGILEGLPHYMMGTAIPFSWVEIIWLPIFKPNDYFFKNHQKENEEKWQTYTRVVRSIMAETGNYEMVDESIEDKFEYKKIMFPKKGADAAAEAKKKD